MTTTITITNPDKLTALDIHRNMTGLEEQSVRKMFGDHIDTIVEDDLRTWGRALVYVLGRRAGLDEAAAHAQVMEAPMPQINALFADTDDDPDDESTPAGNDEPATEKPPRTSRSSASRRASNPPSTSD